MKKISACVNKDVVWIEYENNCLCNTLKINRGNDRGILNLFKHAISYIMYLIVFY